MTREILTRGVLMSILKLKDFEAIGGSFPIQFFLGYYCCGLGGRRLLLKYFFETLVDMVQSFWGLAVVVVVIYVLLRYVYDGISHIYL